YTTLFRFRVVRVGVEALQEAAQRLDFLVGERPGNGGHDLEVGAVDDVGVAGAVFLQALDHVGRLLAADVRVGRARVAAAGGAVAGHAGRDAALGVAALEQAFADLVELQARIGTLGDQGVV